MLCREVLVMEIFKYPKRSKERGELWHKIATSLNNTSTIKFSVNKRSVRDRLTLLINKYREKINKEEKSSGIACDDDSEVEIAVAEIIEKEKAADLLRKENSNTLTKKDENDKASAEEVRLKAMERLGQTKKRNSDSGCDEVTPPKSRKNASEAVHCMKEKMAQECEIRKKELEVRKKEQENQLGQYRMMMEQQTQQQKQFQDVLKAMNEQQQRQEQQLQSFQMMFFQQQQQQSQLLMGLLKKVLPKSS